MACLHKVEMWQDVKASRRDSFLEELEDVGSSRIMEEFQRVQWASLGGSLGEGWEIKNKMWEGFAKVFGTLPLHSARTCIVFILFHSSKNVLGV